MDTIVWHNVSTNRQKNTYISCNIYKYLLKDLIYPFSDDIHLEVDDFSEGIKTKIKYILDHQSKAFGISKK